MTWRWDQGRLDYSQFGTVKLMAGVLAAHDGANMVPGDDPIKVPLQTATGLPFAPDSEEYPVWRNYGRTFQANLLATKVDGKLRVTGLCRQLAADEIGADAYLRALIRRFYLPAPAFSDYEAGVERVYPLCAVLRFLAARAQKGDDPSATLEEIFSHVVANGMTGSEPLEAYGDLPAGNYTKSPAEERQVREMVIVASQVSFLQWDGERLSLDVLTEEQEALNEVVAIATPEVFAQAEDRPTEVLSLGQETGAQEVHVPVLARESPQDVEFTEGKRVRKEHLRRERNRTLVKKFFESLEPPYECDFCGAHVNARYPWVVNLLEAHHVLPLSSPVRAEATGTKLEELVPICPTCHRAAHAYYRRWLRDNEQDDFESPEQSTAVYNEARNQFVADDA